jgi:flagellum-specific ATP synthase
MQLSNFDSLTAEIASLNAVRFFGDVTQTAGNSLTVEGLLGVAHVGDLVRLSRGGEDLGYGEVLSLNAGDLTVLPERGVAGFAIGDRVQHVGPSEIAPDPSWLGRVLDPFGAPLDDKPLLRGREARPVLSDAPAAAQRRRLGGRLETGVSALNTFLPLVRGQRIGLFAGSGVGKTTLLGNLARGVSADICVFALIGERGRELREFIEDVLGPEGLARSIIVAATSDQSPMARRRAAWLAMAIAEFFRDQGAHVFLLADSLTRFAEAHREIATTMGEAASLRGFPPSTSQTIMQLCERAGPGPEGAGDITAIFSVLVAGSDMEEPIADIVRGVLDGHVVMDRAIAERGRFPAIDVLRSVSRSLPHAASEAENTSLSEARKLMGDFAEAELMIQSGLYSEGSSAEIDRAVLARPRLEAFLSQSVASYIDDDFERLRKCLPGDGGAEEED